MAYIKMGWDKLRKLTQQPHTWTGVQTWAAGNIFKQLATIDTPASGYHGLYFKADGYLYTKNSSGTEVAVVTNVNLDAQNSVKSIAVCTSAPPTEVADDRYILDETAGTVHANWDGAAKKDIVQFDGTVWVKTTPTEGMICEVEDVNTLYLYITSWNGWQNQATLTTSGPTFATLTLTTGAGVGLSLVSAAGGLGTWGIAGTAYYAQSAGTAGIAGTAAYATSASNAGTAGTAAFATSAANAGSAGSATTAANSGTAYYSASAGTAGISGTASYSASAGTSGISGTASYATTAGNSGTAYYATSAGGFLGANTFTGVQTTPNQTLPTNGQVLHTAPTTDGHCTGQTTSSFVSGYTSSAVGDLVYLDSDSKWQLCDANTLALYSGLLGIALAIAATDAALLVALPGSMVRASGFPTLTVGSPVYMSETAGAVTHTQPTTADAAIRMIGWGMQADTLYFFPSPDYITHT